MLHKEVEGKIGIRILKIPEHKIVKDVVEDMDINARPKVRNVILATVSIISLAYVSKTKETGNEMMMEKTITTVIKRDTMIKIKLREYTTLGIRETPKIRGLWITRTLRNKANKYQRNI